MTPDKKDLEITPEETKIVFDSMPRRHRRRVRRQRKPKIEVPDLLRGMSNHDRMIVKKVARGGAETRSRRQRIKSNSEVLEDGRN